MLARHFHLARQVRFLTIPSLLVLTSACSARILDVGSTDGGPSSTTGGVAAAGTTPAIKYAPGCAPGVCGNGSTYACAGGTVVSLECAPDPNAGVGSDPAGSCILSGECVDAGTPVCSAPISQCGEDSSGNTVCGAAGGGGGFVSVELDSRGGDASAATSILTAYFNHGVETGDGQTLGSCVFNPYGNETQQSGEVGAPAPDPGTVTVKGPTLDVSAVPACNGLYAPVTSSQTFAAGDLVTFGWNPPSTDPDTFPTGLPSIPAPHLITLGAGQALAPSSPSLARAMDVAVNWTVTGTPMALEQVVVQLTQGIMTVTCSFDASAGSGVVPADALLKLNAAEASYAVFSQHAAELNDSETGWDVSFLLNAVALTPTGVAKGTATLE